MYKHFYITWLTHIVYGTLILKCWWNWFHDPIIGYGPWLKTLYKDSVSFWFYYFYYSGHSISKCLLSSYHVPMWTELAVPSLLLFVAPWEREKIHKKMCLCELSTKPQRNTWASERIPERTCFIVGVESCSMTIWLKLGARKKETGARMRESCSGAFESSLD